MGQRNAAHRQRARNIGQIDVGVCSQVKPQVLRGNDQCRGGLCRYGEQIPSVRRIARRSRGSFFQDDMGVAATDTKGAHRRPAAADGRPVAQLRIYEERTGDKVDRRVRLYAVDARRKLLGFERQHGLDEPGDARCRVQMPDVRLDRTDCAVLARLGFTALGIHQGRHFDGVAELGSSPVGLHVAD